LDGTGVKSNTPCQNDWRFIWENWEDRKTDQPSFIGDRLAVRQAEIPTDRRSGIQRYRDRQAGRQKER
jgi:hypothetical protein